MTREARALPEEDGFPNGDELQRLGVGGWGRGTWRRLGVRRWKSEDERGEGVELIRADRGAPHLHGAEDRSSGRVLDGIEASVGPIREVLGGLEQTGRLSEDLNRFTGSVGDLKEVDTVVRLVLPVVADGTARVRAARVLAERLGAMKQASPAGDVLDCRHAGRGRTLRPLCGGPGWKRPGE